MAPKKNQKSPKQNPQFASPVEMKRPTQAHGEASFTDDEEDEDALEMERNFALVNKRSLEQKSELFEEDEEETSGEESNQADEDDEEENHFEMEHGQAERNDVPMSEDPHNEGRNDPGTRIHTMAGFNQDLSTMSFEEILRLQNKVGTKARNKLLHDSKKNKQKSQPAKRVSKDRPQEISSKRPVSILRKEGSHRETILRDPRFDDLSGDFRPKVFSQTYKFIDDIKHREAEMVKKKLKKVKSAEKKEELKSFLKRMENQKRNNQRQEQQREKDLQYKRKQRALVEDGHRPFYLKNSDKKKLQLAEKYNELKKSGKLQNFLSKKRKRNAMKDRKKLP